MGKWHTEQNVSNMSERATPEITPAVAEALRQILPASGLLTHEFSRALADPRFSGLSFNSDIAVLSSPHLAGPQRPREQRRRTGLTDGGTAGCRTCSTEWSSNCSSPGPTATSTTTGEAWSFRSPAGVHV